MAVWQRGGKSLWIPPPILLWLPVDWAVRLPPISTKWKWAWIRNLHKHWQTRAKCNDIIANVISANQHFPSTFSMQIFKFQRHSCKLSFLFLPHRQSALESLLTGYMAAGTFISGLHCMAQHLVNQLTTITPLITLLATQYYYCLGGLLHGDL